MRHSDKVKKVHIVILDKGKERTFQMSAAFTIPHVSRIHHTTCQPHSPYHMSAAFTIPHVSRIHHTKKYAQNTMAKP